MTLADLIERTGSAPVLRVLLLTLAVALLRLVALPMAVAVLVLDDAADVIAAELGGIVPAPATGREGHR